MQIIYSRIACSVSLVTYIILPSSSMKKLKNIKLFKPGSTFNAYEVNVELLRLRVCPFIDHGHTFSMHLYLTNVGNCFQNSKSRYNMVDTFDLSKFCTLQNLKQKKINLQPQGRIYMNNNNKSLISDCLLIVQMQTNKQTKKPYQIESAVKQSPTVKDHKMGTLGECMRKELIL